MRTLTLAVLLTIQLCAQTGTIDCKSEAWKDCIFSSPVSTTGLIPVAISTTELTPAFYSFSNANGTEYLRITMTKQGTSLQTVEYSLPHSKITLTGAEFEQALIDFARKRERESGKILLPGSASWITPTFPSNVP